MPQQTGTFDHLLRSFLLPLAIAAIWPVAAGRAAEEHAAMAARILAKSQFRGGLIVHVGCGDGQLTAALGRGEHRLVHGLDTEGAQVERARDFLRAQGLYGKVSVEQFGGSRLPYASNLVNLVVVSHGGDNVPRREIERVLCPGGAAVLLPQDAASSPASEIDPEVYRKPRPDELDDWTHFLYDASGNAVSHDRRVGPLDRLQWDGAPRWSRSHETDMSLTACVSAGGRLFYTMDDGPIGIHETPRTKRLLPDKCSLVARDAFNGVVLWKRPLPNWGSAAWDANRWRFGKGDQLWSAPLTLPRRLVATADRIYMTLGFRACVSELDAATGQTLREFPETLAAEELILSGQTLVVRVRHVDDRGQSVAAVDLASGNVLWRRPVNGIADLTLAASDGRVCFYDTKELVALDLRSGTLLWQSAPATRPQRRLDAATLVMADGVVLFAAAPIVEARRATDGELLWRDRTNTSFRGMPDLFVIDHLAWVGTLTTSGRDLLTGKPKREIDPGYLFTEGHHVRCYRGKATENFLLWSKRGIEFVDVHSDHHARHDWVRGTCRYGIIPANGLVYAPPNPCFCYPGVKLTGFNALAPGDQETAEPAEQTVESQLEKGPAYGESVAAPADVADPEDWPTYRHDNARSGATATKVPLSLQKQWSTALPGKNSPPVLAHGRLFVAQLDSHSVTCIDASNGRVLWTYTAGGPVDSPPTVDRGLVVFGCRDGCVYCLRARDGTLVWRFRARPEDRRIVSYGRLESAWPVPGSVLVQDGVAYFAAGRSSYLDGGMDLYGLDVVTGDVRHHRHLAGPAPDLSVPSTRAHEMDGTKNDILVSNGNKIFLTQNVFDLRLNPLEAPKIAKWGARQTDLHLVASGGFLDDSGFDRLFWMYARRWPGLYVADRASKAGQILVFNEKTTYGLHTFNQKFGRSPYFAPATEGYELFADDNDNEPVLTDDAARRERGSMTRTRPPKWSVHIPARARAMVLADDRLFLAGPPDVIDPEDPFGAFEGRKGARLWAVDTADGSKLAEYTMEHPPVFDGMIAAHGRLYITTEDGRVACWARRSQ